MTESNAALQSGLFVTFKHLFISWELTGNELVKQLVSVKFRNPNYNKTKLWFEVLLFMDGEGVFNWHSTINYGHGLEYYDVEEAKAHAKSYEWMIVEDGQPPYNHRLLKSWNDDYLVYEGDVEYENDYFVNNFVTSFLQYLNEGI